MISISQHMPSLLFFLLAMIGIVSASVGDNSLVYRRCLGTCKYDKCFGVTEEEFYKSQPFYMRWLYWNCESECKYLCMWQAVDAFQKDGTRVPQFHGKWPFVRFFGIQEPASSISSALNGLSVLIGLIMFHRRVPSTAPMRTICLIDGVIYINTWVWSTVFHARDFPFTEKMDYFCALSLVLASLVSLIVRVIHTRPAWRVVLVTIPFISFFTFHCYYLTFVKFDYKYNLTVHLVMGVINSVSWSTWCLIRWKRRYYVRYCMICIVLMNVTVSLEVKDFRPLLWVFDAHSIWHIGTIPIGVIWFLFLAEDCIYIHKTLEAKGKLE